MSEAEIQKSCTNELDAMGIEWYHPQTAHTRRGRCIEKKGWPDLVFCLRRTEFGEGDNAYSICVPVPIAIELKIPGKNPDADQKARLHGMKYNGWEVYCCHSVREFHGVLAGTHAELTDAELKTEGDG